MRRPIILFAVIGVLLLAAIGTTLWRYDDAAPAPDLVAGPLAVPPFPPRIASGEAYEQCLAALTDDPDSARLLADTWAADGGGDGAAHCQGLALIATGRPDQGAERLEQLASSSLAPDMAKAIVFAQAAQARLMAKQPAKARADTTEALKLAPDDTEILIQHAETADALEDWKAAIDDLTLVLGADPHRTDALVLRAADWRRAGHLDLAVRDADRALGIDPDNAEALLERGIERQRLGDTSGARADWQRARGLDPNSTTADLADQNLALLDAGPNQR